MLTIFSLAEASMLHAAVQLQDLDVKNTLLAFAANKVTHGVLLLSFNRLKKP